MIAERDSSGRTATTNSGRASRFERPRVVNERAGQGHVTPGITCWQRQREQVARARRAGQRRRQLFVRKQPVCEAAASCPTTTRELAQRRSQMRRRQPSRPAAPGPLPRSIALRDDARRSSRDAHRSGFGAQCRPAKRVDEKCARGLQLTERPDAQREDTMQSRSHKAGTPQRKGTQAATPHKRIGGVVCGGRGVEVMKEQSEAGDGSQALVHLKSPRQSARSVMCERGEHWRPGVG
ncbi:hypothetical protein BDV96DRAFT_637489 [Lophiotrema nucula]|uniref:Uncharacterized protein n=1 Tax=Lophiotrema nucula TaxID=690887 RepID=A0A6A5YKH5_9PLEO|nr:hypothetical protein BDV96DRAFT_637489 [Lophiotrema nucula]